MKDIGVDHQMIKPSTKLWEIQIQSPFSSDWSISQSSVGWCRFFLWGLRGAVCSDYSFRIRFFDLSCWE